jgi:predicted membrane protein (TIGR00267 family)
MAEQDKKTMQSKLNWLRAAVLGANDGIVSVAALIVGVASAFSDERTLLVTGTAGLLAGALSMSLGEYISVSTQRDLEKAHHGMSQEHMNDPEGVNHEEGEFTNPWEAALASALSFSVGGLVPLLALYFSPINIRLPITYAAVLVALVITGILSARASKAPVVKATLRVIIGGIIAMAITTGVGRLFGVSGV